MSVVLIYDTSFLLNSETRWIMPEMIEGVGSGGKTFDIRVLET